MLKVGFEVNWSPATKGRFGGRQIDAADELGY